MKQPTKPKPVYNLPFWKKILLPIVWLSWAGIPEDKRLSWHKVKKSMEPHACNYSVPIIELGYKLLQCSHEGCNMCLPAETLEERLVWLDNKVKGTKQEDTEPK